MTIPSTASMGFVGFMGAVIAVTLCVAGAPAVWADASWRDAQQNAQQNARQDADQYAQCVRRAGRDPAAALSMADQWAQSGGGDPARHCRAAALEALGRAEEAATTVAALAATAPPETRPSLYAQLGALRLSLDDPAGAAAAYTAGLAQASLAASDRSALLRGAAQAAAAQGDFQTAYARLTQSLTTEPSAEAYVLRAAAARRLGRVEQAATDAGAALALQPTNALALFERGAARALRGDRAGAAADWRLAAALAPNSPAAALARRNLERLLRR